jgi:hypothetical protein
VVDELVGAVVAVPHDREPLHAGELERRALFKQALVSATLIAAMAAVAGEEWKSDYEQPGAAPSTWWPA